jgi:hypothetical protein
MQMGERIAALTPKQKARLPEFRESWRKTALSTARIDPAAARRAVGELYGAFALPAPKAVVCLDSPMACLLARGILVTLIYHSARRFPSCYVSFYDRNLEKYLREDLGEPFSIGVWHAMWDQLREQLGDARWRDLIAVLKDVVEPYGFNPPGHALHRSFGPQVSDRLAPELRELLVAEIIMALQREIGRLKDPIEAHIRYEFDYRVNGHSAPSWAAYLRRELPPSNRTIGASYAGGEETWIAFYEFAEQVGARFDRQSKRQLEAFKQYIRGCGWIYAFRSIAFVSDRPAELHFDAQHRLHHADGPAARYRDGSGAYVWHGTAVPRWLITDRAALTPAAIERLPNVEARRAALEIYGLDRYLAARKPKLVAADELHGRPRRLLEVDVAGSPFRIIEVVNGTIEPDGTRRKFHLGAMPGATPAEVVAASYGIAPPHYREAVRT